MKPINFLLALFIVTVILICKTKGVAASSTVNSILGDISFMEIFKRTPTGETNEDLRIHTHLQYVERLLREKDVSALSEELKEKRNSLLDLLHEYWIRGIFPRNYDYPGQRVPCFLDKNGRICAVGYLIAQTAGRQVAEKINEEFQYEKIMAMNMPTVDDWIAASGLTKEECAMIQPSYGPAPGSSYITPAYGVISSVWGGVNLSLNTINAIQVSNGTGNKAIPVISLLSGTGSLIYGALNFSKSEGGFGMYATSNEGQKVLSMVNMGFGTTTLMLGIWNLAANRGSRNKSLTWNIYNFQTANKQTGLGLQLIKRM